jgi:hypothetical protein
MKKPKNLSKKLVKNPTNPTSALRQNVDMLMDVYGYTLSETSEKADISLEKFKSFFYGKSDECRLSTAIKLARLFGLSVDELAGAETISTEMEEYINMYKSLPEYSKYLVKYFISHQNNIYQRRAVMGKKVISVLQPPCVDSYLQTTNVTEELCIEHLNENIKSKVSLGLKIPCEHYMPIYSPHDILLIAADREAHHGERCVIEMNNNLFIVEKRTVVKNGVKMSEYVSLMNGRFTVPATEIDYKIGYIVGFLNAQDGTWGVR